MKSWIDPGNDAEVHRLEIGVPVRTDPWSELVAFRAILAHTPPRNSTLTGSGGSPSTQPICSCR